MTVFRRRGRAGTEHTVVALAGELDVAALQELAPRLDDAIAGYDADVVVDLAGVEFMGAAWIGTLVRSRALAETRGRTLTLQSPPSAVSRVLDVCGLEYLVSPGSVSPG